MIKLLVEPSYKPDSDDAHDTGEIALAVESLGGSVVSHHRWAMIIRLDADKIGAFVEWAMENLSLFHDGEVKIEVVFE
jgi:hypothetical protein